MLTPDLQIRVPKCPWCDAVMKWLFEENQGDFSKEYQDTCRECQKPVFVKADLVLTIYATMVEKVKPSLVIIDGGKKEGVN